MREIKFRGKRTDNDKWIYGGILTPTELYSEYEISDCESIDGSRYEVDEDTIGQYTGLHDKNGKEIYEGDIVLYEDWESCWEGGGNDNFINKGIIEYIDENCCFNVTERQTAELGDVLYKGNDTLEVIGNIYDNPELLEE